MKQREDFEVMKRLIPICERNAAAFRAAGEQADHALTECVLEQLECKHDHARGALREAARQRGLDLTGSESAGERDERLRQHLVRAVNDECPGAMILTLEVFQRVTIEAFAEGIREPVSGPVRDVLVFEKDRLQRAYEQVSHLARLAA